MRNYYNTFKLLRLLTLTTNIIRSMSNNIIRDSKTNTIIINPLDGKHSASVLIMHGLGDSAEGFVDVAEMLSYRLPYVKFILPTAPSSPVTLNGGMVMNSWYDIVGLDDRASETCDGLDESRNIVTNIIESEVNLGIPYSRIVLAGFSQGGAMSLVTGLQLPAEKQVAGILVMSGYLPRANAFRLTHGLENTPILHCHGLADPMVRYNWAENTQAEIQRQGALNYELKSYRGLGHSLNEQVIQDALKFISERLPDDPSFALPAKSPSEMSIKELKEAIRQAGLSHRANGFREKSEFVELLTEYRNSNNK